MFEIILTIVALSGPMKGHTFEASVPQEEGTTRAACERKTDVFIGKEASAIFTWHMSGPLPTKKKDLEAYPRYEITKVRCASVTKA